MISERELAWAAGLFEGEGTVRINSLTRRNLGALIVGVTNTDRQIVDWFQARWPGCLQPVKGMRPDQRPAWVWVIAALQAAAFLRQILPHVMTNRVREKATFGIWYQEQKTRDIHINRTYEYLEQQWCAWLWMAQLNRRGNQEACVNAAQHRKWA